MRERKKRLIIHLDDIGINDGSVQAAKTLLETGRAGSASVIVPGSGAQDFLRWAASNADKRWDTGIHSAVTCEWPRNRWKALGRPEKTGSFTASDGCMVSGQEKELERILPEAYEEETSAQIERARALGCRPTHLDNHMWTVRSSPQMLEAYIRTAERYGLIPHIPGWLLFSEERKRIAGECGRPVVTGEWFLTGTEPESYAKKKEKLIELLMHLPEGLNVLTVHPNKDTPQARGMLSCLQERQEEYRLLMDEEIGDILGGIRDILTNWREVKEERNR